MVRLMVFLQVILGALAMIRACSVVDRSAGMGTMLGQRRMGNAVMVVTSRWLVFVLCGYSLQWTCLVNLAMDPALSFPILVCKVVSVLVSAHLLAPHLLTLLLRLMVLKDRTTIHRHRNLP